MSAASKSAERLQNEEMLSKDQVVFDARRLLHPVLR